MDVGECEGRTDSKKGKYKRGNDKRGMVKE